MTQNPKPFGLYIHWPYCVSKCPYCDFNSHVAQTVDHDLWADCFQKELIRAHAETQGRTLTSIFFGGGTPSLMKPSLAGSIIETADHLWGLSEDCEITLEANPTTVEKNTFRDFKAAGVNRLSIGVQSLKPDVLKFLGRAHDEAQARAAIDQAQKIFDRFSFDLIYAYPDQSLEDWEAELTEALSLSVGHLSVYQLTIEPGTDFFKQKVPAMDGDRAADFYDLTQSVLSNGGLAAYEVSNHSRPGEESRHNLVYWEGHDYLGIGPGAHSRLKLDNSFYGAHQIYKPDLWLNALKDGKSGEQKRKKIDDYDRSIEILMMGLRLNNGLNLKSFEQITRKQISDILDETRIRDLKDEKLITMDEHVLKATPEGMKCLNGVLSHLIS